MLKSEAMQIVEARRRLYAAAIQFSADSERDFKIDELERAAVAFANAKKDVDAKFDTSDEPDWDGAVTKDEEPDLSVWKFDPETDIE